MDEDEKKLHALINTLQGDEVEQYLSRKEIQCAACKSANWMVPKDAGSKVAGRALIRASLLIANLGAEHTLEVGSGLSPPMLTATCLNCGYIASFDAVVVGMNLMYKVDGDG